MLRIWMRVSGGEEEEKVVVVVEEEEEDEERLYLRLRETRIRVSSTGMGATSQGIKDGCTAQGIRDKASFR